jgi:hypothetical protein
MGNRQRNGKNAATQRRSLKEKYALEFKQWARSLTRRGGGNGGIIFYLGSKIRQGEEKSAFDL